MQQIKWKKPTRMGIAEAVSKSPFRQTQKRIFQPLLLSSILWCQTWTHPATRGMQTWDPSELHWYLEVWFATYAWWDVIFWMWNFRFIFRGNYRRFVFNKWLFCFVWKLSTWWVCPGEVWASCLCYCRNCWTRWIWVTQQDVPRIVLMAKWLQLAWRMENSLFYLWTALRFGAKSETGSLQSRISGTAAIAAALL